MPSAGALGKLLPPDVIKSLASLAKVRVRVIPSPNPNPNTSPNLNPNPKPTPNQDTAQLPPRRPGAAAARPLDFPAQGSVEPATITAPDASGKIRITADGASSPAARLQALGDVLDAAVIVAPFGVRAPVVAEEDVIRRVVARQDPLCERCHGIQEERQQVDKDATEDEAIAEQQ